MPVSTPRYVLAYFTDQSDNFHLAVSDDGMTFSALAGGEPLVRSTVGSRIMRDPFVGRDSTGLFHLVATDGWHSTSIVHSVSRDLLNWSETELIPLMADVPHALNTWAPEFYLLPDGTVRIIWSSTVDPAADRGDDGSVNWDGLAEPQRIWAATTRDFRTFSPSEVFFAPKFSVIDASVHIDDEVAIMIFKDERGQNFEGTAHKDLHVVALDREGRPSGEPWPVGSPHLVEGPDVYRLGSELRMVFDVFLTPDYASMSSRDGRDWVPADIHMPPLTKHASVLELTGSESAALVAALAPSTHEGL